MVRYFESWSGRFFSVCLGIYNKQNKKKGGSIEMKNGIYNHENIDTGFLAFYKCI
jgi:hypothetical protein